MKRTQFLRSTLLALGLVALPLAGCRVHPSLQPDHPRLVPGVTVQDVSFFSAVLQRPMPYRVFLPAKLVPGQKLPVVYLLHGNGGRFSEWSNGSDVAQYAGHGLILVMPAGDSSYYVNAALQPEDRYEDYFVHDLIADVETRFPAASGRENRAVIGVSMGGYAAIYCALSHPELFSFAGGISPAIDVPSRRFTVRRWWQSVRFRTIFGPDGSQSRQSRNPFLLVQSANPAVTPYIYLTAGEQEPLLEPNRRFAAQLGARHFAYEFHTKPGGHDWSEWDSQIPGCFESLFQHIATAR